MKKKINKIRTYFRREMKKCLAKLFCVRLRTLNVQDQVLMPFTSLHFGTMTYYYVQQKVKEN
ncbi:unnamed protein product [Acanthoscelides obtectus]|uniref:Uncharacterized protein n=1 Tax=Acanthoscelides obtectus TaxID=200917 RepID=A0A9P0JY28_ACAOB|nr:unnamed protein product [Acanthoscelides obtectus]CAK1633992.1 hypothetical protein AOBTE_LOCUS8523 [Acanthoscelides obtectus]